MELTIEDREILAHVVEDPDKWVAHAIATVGEHAVTAKIARWKPVYETEKTKPDYKNRIRRDAVEKELLRPTKEQTDRAKRESLVQAKIREQAITALYQEGKLTVDGKIPEIK